MAKDTTSSFEPVLLESALDERLSERQARTHLPSWLWAVLWICSVYLAKSVELPNLSGIFSKSVLDSPEISRRTRASAPNDIIPWAACPDLTEYDCAYLSVPLDYTNPKPNETVSIALRRLPSTAPLSERLGPLLLNPGGPGGSGSQYVVRRGKEISVILEGKYDLISWDPRGASTINMTTPSIDCFASEGDSMRIDSLEALIPYPFESNYSTDSIKLLDAHYAVWGQACATHGNQNMLRAVSTAFVARDMKSIMEALGQEKLNFWGFSYGTYLGATFAAMFPDLINRFVLDGVCDAETYSRDLLEYAKTRLRNNKQVYEGFLSSCTKAGPSRCALAKNSTDPSDQITDLIKTLQRSPMPIPRSNSGPGVLRASDVISAIYSKFYAPSSWPSLASALYEASQSNGTAIFEMTHPSSSSADYTPRATDDNLFHRTLLPSSTSVINHAIACGHAPPVSASGVSAEDLKPWISDLNDLSIAGEATMDGMAACRHWTIEPYEAYRGPWSVEDGLNTTSFPILFIGNTADPATPLPSAEKMTKGFGPDSARLLIQDGYGHCSLAMPSICTAKTVRSYFLDGALPDSGTHCDVEDGFLFPEDNYGTTMNTVPPGDKALAEALMRLSEEPTSISSGMSMLA
ncbi:hypothetical protein SISNIDRAFT_492314 [Sistotremastrum niveocremeum HHB9708]|uniref:Uncharacterized protein n=1 Tax=Sistotremastrum niveocremeum HHB9708 TaxID=1314777 RepID=A0A165AHR9_9AGAM|nr:hypothetical protein SISNIDRAFT_492314 [Sistotremastrum niveocremeum HHB9708]